MTQVEKFYSGGQIALSIDEKSKSGFIYYPSGKVAVAISTASSYQNAFYAYDNDKKGSLLLGLNERAVGFATSSKQSSISSDLKRVSVVLTPTGGVLTDAKGTIIQEWAWNKKISTDNVLNDFLSVKLSDHIEINFKSKEEINLNFTYENVKHSVDMGFKVLRQKPSYLQKAKRLPGGHLLPMIDHLTLKKVYID